MTEKQFKRAVEINDRLIKLIEIKKEISNTRTHRLSYSFENSCGDYSLCSDWLMRPIGEILDRHDEMIRKEIDDEIQKLEEETRTL